jgi:hypothetical protein
MTVMKLRTIAMVADKMGEKGAFIFCLPNQGKSSFFLHRCGGEELGFASTPDSGFFGGRSGGAVRVIPQECFTITPKGISGAARILLGGMGDVARHKGEARETNP